MIFTKKDFPINYNKDLINKNILLFSTNQQNQKDCLLY